MKKLTAILLALVLGLGAFSFTVTATEEALLSTKDAPWSYDNSMLIKIETEEAKSFSPADFPEVDCTEVRITEKKLTDTGYRYELMLIFNTADGFRWQSAADALLEKDGVVSAYRNVYSFDYDEKGQVCTLNEAELHLQVGESADLNIELVSLDCFWSVIEFEGVYFKIDPQVINESTLTPNSFARYGIYEYAPYRGGGYLCPLKDVGKCLEIIEKLNVAMGFSEVAIAQTVLPTGNRYAEYWTVEDDSVASMTLSGGDDGGYGDIYTLLNQTAKITGLSVGKTTVTVERSGWGASATAACTVFVSGYGDVNLDCEINSLDAALILKHDAALLTLSAKELALADVDGDGTVNSLDAALVLKYDANLIDEFPNKEGADNTDGGKTNYAQGMSYTISKNLCDYSPEMASQYFLPNYSGSNAYDWWGDEEFTKLTDGNTVNGSDLYSAGGLEKVSVRFLSALYEFVIDLGETKTDISSVVIKGICKNDVTGFDDDRTMIYTSDTNTFGNWGEKIETSLHAEPLPNAPVYYDEDEGYRVANYTYTINFNAPASGRYVRILISTPNHALQLDEIEVYGKG